MLLFVLSAMHGHGSSRFLYSCGRLLARRLKFRRVPGSPQAALKGLQREGEELRKEQFKQGQALFTLRQRERELINEITGAWPRCHCLRGCCTAPAGAGPSF
jgi:hypothetical protein